MLKKSRDFLRLRHAKAHDDGALKNPLFVKPTRSKWIPIFLSICATLCVLGIGIGVTYIPLLQVEDVSVIGAINIEPSALSSAVLEDIASRAWPLCSKNSLLFASAKDIEGALMNTNALDSVSVAREGRRLVVTVHEKVTTIVVRTKEKTVMLDVSGQYVRDATQEESHAVDVRFGVSTQGENDMQFASDVPMVMDLGNDVAPSLSSSKASAMMDIASLLPSIGIQPTIITLTSINAPDARVSTAQGPDILFDLTTHSIADQVQAVHAILTSSKIQVPTEYIDVRFGAYVYTK